MWSNEILDKQSVDCCWLSLLCKWISLLDSGYKMKSSALKNVFSSNAMSNKQDMLFLFSF